MVSWRGCFGPAITSTISPSERSKQLSRKTSHIHSVNIVECKTYCNLHFADSIARYPKPSDCMHSVQPCRLQRLLGKMRTPHVQEPRGYDCGYLRIKVPKASKSRVHGRCYMVDADSTPRQNTIRNVGNCTEIAKGSKGFKRSNFSSAAGPLYICIWSFQVSLRMIGDLKDCVVFWSENEWNNGRKMMKGTAWLYASSQVYRFLKTSKYDASRGCSTFWLTVAMTDGHIYDDFP